jgi:hypothetical protein
MDFSQYIHKAELSQNEFCRLFNVSFKTFQRYKKTNKYPLAVRIALELVAGEVPYTGFEGWYFKNGLLCDSNGNKFSSGDILSIIYDRQLIKSLEIENKRLKKKVANRKPNNVIQFPTKLKNNSHFA